MLAEQAECPFPLHHLMEPASSWRIRNYMMLFNLVSRRATQHRLLSQKAPSTVPVLVAETLTVRFLGCLGQCWIGLPPTSMVEPSVLEATIHFIMWCTSRFSVGTNYI